MGSRSKIRLTIAVAITGMALSAAPQALADNPPTQVSPSDLASFTARADQIAFQARAPAAPLPFPSRLDFYVSKSNAIDSDTGVLSSPTEIIHAGPDTSTPPHYTASPDADANWPNRPGTYYWQAVYKDCAQSLPPDCLNQSTPLRSFTLDPLPPPTQGSPPDDATIPFGGQRTFSLVDVSSYTHEGTGLYIEFSRSAARAPDGTFANPLLIARPAPAAGSSYEHNFGTPFTNDPGTYYWTVERFDCAAEPDPDCYVTDNEVRSFTVADPPQGVVPNTVLRHHPGHRTHKRRIRFTFGSNVRGASFQCFYTGGWTACQSPQRFRHLKPGRYRFKARAVFKGKKDPTPVRWLFKVVRRHHR
jgi:hypothetical protein